MKRAMRGWGIIMSKQAKYIMAIMAGFFLVAVLFSDMWSQSARWYKGQRTKNPNLYDMQIESMNGKDSHTMHAIKGQKIVVKYDIYEGNANIEIKCDGQDAIYSEKGISQASISFDVKADGDYTVTVRSRRSKGKIRVEIVDGEI